MHYTLCNTLIFKDLLYAVFKHACTSMDRECGVAILQKISECIEVRTTAGLLAYLELSEKGK